MMSSTVHSGRFIPTKNTRVSLNYGCILVLISIMDYDRVLCILSFEKAIVDFLCFL